MDASASKKGGAAVKDAAEIAKDTENIDVEGYGGDREVVKDKTKLSLEVLMASDEGQLKAFVGDMNKLKEDERQNKQQELAQNSEDLLEQLAKQVERERPPKKDVPEGAKAEDAEKREEDLEDEEREPGPFFEKGDDFAAEIFMIVESEDDLGQKVEQINVLLEEVKRRSEIKQATKESLNDLGENKKTNSLAFIGFVVGLPGFALLAPQIKNKIESMKNEDPATISKYVAQVIKKETGEDVDPEEMFLAASLGGVDFKSKDKGTMKWVKDMIGTIEGNSYVVATKRFSLLLGIPFGMMAQVGMASIGALREKVAYLYEDEVKANFKDPEKAEQAWGYIENIQKIVDWSESEEDELMGRFEESLYRNNSNLSDAVIEKLKAKVKIDNLRVSQAAMIMFGDLDLVGKELLKGATWAGKTMKFYKNVLKDRYGGKTFFSYLWSGERKAIRPAANLAREVGNLAKAAGLNSKQLGNALDVVKSLDKSINELGEAVVNKGKLTPKQLLARTKAIETYIRAREEMMKGFQQMAGKLEREARLMDTLKNAGNKRVNQLNLSAFSDILASYDIKPGSMQTAGHAWGKVRSGYLPKAANLSMVQSTLLEAMTAKRSKLVGKLGAFNEFVNDANKLAAGGKLNKKTLETVENITTWGKVKNWGPKLGLPVFSLGSTLHTAITQKQGFKKTGWMVAEVGLSFVPFFGGGMDIYLGARGYDLAGNKLSVTSRALYMGFGAVSLVADLFGAYPVRAGLAVVTKGRRTVKAVETMGEGKSVLLRAVKGLKGTASRLGRKGRHTSAHNAEMMMKVHELRRLQELGEGATRAQKLKLKALQKETKTYKELLGKASILKARKFERLYASGQGFWRAGANIMRDGVNWVAVKGSQIHFGFKRIVRRGKDVYLKTKNGVLKAGFAEARLAYAGFGSARNLRRGYEARLAGNASAIASWRRKVDALEAKKATDGVVLTAQQTADLARYKRKIEGLEDARKGLTFDKYKTMKTDEIVAEIGSQASRSFRVFDGAMARVEKLAVAGGAVAGLAYLVSQGNITPSDLGEYTVKGAEKVADAGGYAMDKFDNPTPRVRAADQVIAAIVREQQLAEMALEKIHAEGGVANEMDILAKHIDSPAAQTLAIRSGIDPLEIASGDSGKKTNDLIG